MFGLTGRNLPRVRSYQDALRLWDRAVVRPDGSRAIASKRDSSKVMDRRDDTIIFRYHQTDVVKWHSPTRITITYFDSNSTVVFIDAFSPPGIDARMVSRELYVNGVARKHASVTFRLVNGTWHPDEEDVEIKTQIVLDRKRAAEIRKHFKPLLEWRDGMSRLKNETMVSTRNDVWISPVDAILALREMTTKDFMVHARLLPKDETTLAYAYARGGALTRQPLPVGVVPTKTKWDAYAGAIV